MTAFYKVDVIGKDGDKGYYIYKAAKANIEEVLNDKWLKFGNDQEDIISVGLVWENDNIQNIVDTIEFTFTQISKLGEMGEMSANVARDISNLTYAHFDEIQGTIRTLEERIKELRVFLGCLSQWNEEPKEGEAIRISERIENKSTID